MSNVEKPDLESFKADLAIDPASLDVEAIRQAELFFKWAEKSATAKAEVDRLKLKMDTTESKLDARARRDPEAFGISKSTEGAISAAIKAHPDYIAAQEVWMLAREAGNLIDRAVEAMEQKKRMIEVLVTLHGQQFFAGPSVPHNLAESYMEQTKQREENLNQRQAQKARIKKRG
jgi:arginine utilization protein RocB